MALPNSLTERAQLGAKVRREVLGAAYVDSGKQRANAFTQHFIEFTQTQCWGNVWLREGLSRKTRSMLNVAMLAAMARWHELEVHIRGALNNGVTPEEIAEILLQAGVYAGIRSRRKASGAPTPSSTRSRRAEALRLTSRAARADGGAAARPTPGACQWRVNAIAMTRVAGGIGSR